MKSGITEESSAPSSGQVRTSSIARQVLKHKNISKPGKGNLDLQLDKIIGITAKGKKSFAFNPVTGDLAYPAGSIVILYNAKANKQTRYFFSPSKKSVTALCFSPDGKYLAIASKGLEVSIWDLHITTNQPAFTIKGHKYGIDNILFSPNMQYFVSIGDANDKGLFVCDWANETILTKNKVSKKINSAVFTSSGQYLITAGEQHLKFWFFDPLGNILYAKPKDAAGKDNSSDISVITASTSSNNINIIEGKGANLGKMADKVFMDVVCQNQQVYAITLDGILCIINENTRAIEKWMDLKVPSGFSVLTTHNYLICSCGDGFIRFFKAQTMEHVFVLPKPPSLGSYNIEKGAVTKLAGRPNEKYADAIAIAYDEKNHKMATLYSDRTVFIWDLKNTDRIMVYRSFLNHSGAIYDIQPLPAMSSYEITFFATGSNDKTVRVWHLTDSDNKENEKVIKRNAYCKNLSRIIYVNESFDHFKYQHTDEIENYTLQDYQIRCLKCSSQGDCLATGDQVGYLRVYNLSNFQLLHELKAHDQEILCMDFCPENEEKVRFLATGSRDRLIHIYDLDKEFNIVTTLDDHTSSISSLRFYYDKSTKKLGLVSCGADKTMIFRVYNPKIKNFETSQVEVDKNNKFHSLDLNQEGTQTVAGQDKKISIWQNETGKQKCVYETKDEDINAKNTYLDNLKVAVDITGSYIAVSNKDGTVRIRDYYTGNLVAKINCGDLSTGICFTQNNKNLITTTADGCILSWALPDEMTNNMNKKKVQLGIVVKKLREMLEEQVNDYSLLRDFKYDSLLIEHELQEYVSKQNHEDLQQRLAEGKLLGDLGALTSEKPALGVTPTKKEGSDKEQLEKIFNESELPTWARTKEPTIAKEPAKSNEKKQPIGGKWLSRAENPTEKSEENIITEQQKPKTPIKPTPVQEGSDGEEADKVYPPSVSAEHKEPIRAVTPEQQIVEDIPEDDDYKESFEDLIDENINSTEDLEKVFGKPETKDELERSKFIEQNYDNLDEEAPASPERLPGVPSHSKVFWQSKSLKKEDQDDEADIEVQLPNEEGEEEKETDEALESQGLIKYKDPSLRESLFDVNAIKNQMSSVSKTLETLEQQLAGSKDNNKLPKNFAYFDQSRNFLSTFDIEEQSQRDESLAPAQPIAEQVLNPKQAQEKSPPPRVSPTRVSPTRYTPQKQTLEENPSAGVIKIEKKNLVPTTLEQLTKKQMTPSPQQDTSQTNRILGSSGHTPKDQDSEKDAESPNKLTITSESKPNRFTLQPPNYVGTDTLSDQKSNPDTQPQEKLSPFRPQFSEQASTIQMGTEWDSEPVSLSYNTSAFQRPQLSKSDKAEAEIEESFSIIKAHLSKIDAIMRSNVNERDSHIKERVADKFEKQYDETRRSVESLGVRSSRSVSNSYDVSQSMMSNSSNMSEFVLANSKDLLENYSKMLMQTFEQQLAQKLKK